MNKEPFDIDMDTDSYNTGRKVLSEQLGRNIDQQTVMVNLFWMKRIHERNQDMMAALTWFEESEKKLYALTDLNTLIGKNEDCQIHIRGGLPGIKHFARITKNGGQFLLNPYLALSHAVEGEVIKTNTPLYDGDRLQIFNQTLHFHEEM